MALQTLTVVLTWEDVDLSNLPPIQWAVRTQKKKVEDEEEAVWEPLGLPDAVTYPDELNHQDLSAWDLNHDRFYRYLIYWNELRRWPDQFPILHSEESAEFLIRQEVVDRPPKPVKPLYSEMSLANPDWKWVTIQVRIGMTPMISVDFPVKRETHICKDCERPLELFSRPLRFDHKGGLCDLCVRRREWKKEWEAQEQSLKENVLPWPVSLRLSEQTMLAAWRKESLSRWDNPELKTRNSRISLYWNSLRELSSPK